MHDILYTGTLPLTTFPQLVKGLVFPQHALFLAEQLPTHVITRRQQRIDLLSFADYSPEIDITPFTSGRIFHPQAELRWERSVDGIRVTYLCDGSDEQARTLQAYNILPDQQAQGQQVQHKDTTYYLFGERLRTEDLEKLAPVVQPGDFAELRIPRILRYPLADQQSRRVLLSVREYRDSETGRVAYFRFLALLPEPAKKGA